MKKLNEITIKVWHRNGRLTNNKKAVYVNGALVNTKDKWQLLQIVLPKKLFI